ncbi:unnamed protein product, partial [Medioppia subpectinata]
TAIIVNNYSKTIDCIDVNTTSGVVRGQTLHVLNTSIDQFLGIPYAKPPVGALRFVKPVAITKPLKEIIDATKPKHSCMQKPVKGLSLSEDCLVLNIWAPNKTLSALKPVMFWIFGGGLSSGSIFMDSNNGSVLATHDVGQKCCAQHGDREDAPGNVGFYDQLLALKWVRKNIHSFGGDRDRITIFGQSAGSWSVSAHILSPLSKGLFKRAIMQSGAHMFNKDRDVFNKTEALSLAKYIATQENCTQSENWLQCLRRVDAQRLVKYNSGLTRPVLGTAFLPLSAQKAFQNKQINLDIDLMAGVTRNEGAETAKLVQTQPDKTTLDQFKVGIKIGDALFHNIDVPKMTDSYLSGVNISDPLALWHSLTDFFGDLSLKCPTYLFARQFSAGVADKHRVYFYELDYESAYTANITGCDPKTMGVCHEADLPFVFGLPFIHTNDYSKQDLVFSRDVMRLWTKFAKDRRFGNEWPQLSGAGVSSGAAPLVRSLDPANMSRIYTDPYYNTCDGVWQTYYQ